jgi:hypothetical protein
MAGIYNRRITVSAALCFILFAWLNGREMSLNDSINNHKDVALYGFYQMGSVLQTNQFLRGNNLNQMPVEKFRAVALQLSIQTKGEKLWEQLYNFPRYGFGLYKPYFPEAKYLGSPYAFYGTIGFALKRWEYTTFFLDLGMGLAFNWNSYLEDRYNLSMGANESVIFNTTFALERRFSNGFRINAGAGFVHFSNGSLKLPNLGINVFTPRIGAGYSFNKPEEKFIYQPVPEYSRQSEINLSAFGGWRNTLYDGTDVDSITQRKGVNYACYGLSISYSYQISHKSKFGVGFMTDYLGFANSFITTDNGKLVANPASLSDGFELSVFPSYELVINRASVILQPGFYLYRSKYPDRTPMVYQRIGLKYYVSDNISFAVNMRAHDWSIADFIEWTIGYSFR